jgi:PAS domain S-box-containing protein
MIKEILSRTQDYLDIAGVIIVVIRPDETVELINKKGCELLGYDKEEIEGKRWFDLFVPEDEKNAAVFSWICCITIKAPLNISKMLY